MDEYSVMATVHQFLNAFGKVVQEICLEKNLTFDELATECGISINHIQDIVNGTVNPSTSSILVKISLGLKMSLSELIVKAEREMKGER